ncbi:surface lipoprotein assembly modifier [Sphingomonas phyllosphaerae]|uniref:surface lipoprotein assembly modifier n=1 Tax=Sphingomonas phyllosphaerae TaxID=257003 RepID=UPI002413AFC6|nr:surface lipoprotein assembly modifier [Sphingomonas phyllosphaerae]
MSPLLVIAAIAAATPLAFSADVAQSRVDKLSAVDLFALADRARAAGHADQALVLYDALARDANADVRAEARFRKGLLLADERRLAEAAATFRALLDEKPGAARVRLELARVLAQLGDESGARRAVRQARAAGLPDDVAVLVDQFARALRSTQPFGGSIQVALAPDTNVNRATQARTLDTVIAPLTLSRDARARSGLGVRLAGQGFARVPLSSNLSLLPRAAMLGSLYRDSRFNDVSASALLGLEWRHGGDRWSPSGGVTQRWYRGAPYARTISGALDWLHPLGRRAQLFVHGGAAASDYRLNDLQDGGLFDASLGYEQATSPRAGFGATLSGYRQTARDPGYATVSGGLSLSAWQELGKTTVFVNTGLSRLEGDERLFLFPDRRREWLVTSSAGATLRQLAVHNFAPLLRLTLERNSSSVGLYSYRRVAGEIGVTRAF